MTYISQEYTETERVLADLLRSYYNNPLNNARLLENISVSSSADTVVNHGLDRVPVGYIIVKKTAAVDVYHTSLSTLTLAVRGSATATISLLVF